MLKGIKLTIAYDGTGYAGWQKQLEDKTVQEEIEKVCNQVFGHKVRVSGAGRTDAGVHADGQVAAIQVDTQIEVSKIPLIFNTKLPKDIVITKAEEVPVEFHPTEDVIYKIYEYKILNADFRDVRLRNYSYFYPRKLNLEAMQKAAKFFEGEHDFVGFCSSKIVALNTVRSIMECTVDKADDGMITIRVKGKGFLHNMVRIIAGTLIFIGAGTIDGEKIEEIIESKDRQRAGFTAPAWGLTMKEVHY